MGADTHKLMNYGKPTQNRPVIHQDVTGQLRVVGKYRVVTHLAVMGQMDVGHDPVVIADPRHTQVTRRPDIESAKFSDGVLITNDQLTGLTRVFFVLWNGT